MSFSALIEIERYLSEDVLRDSVGWIDEPTVKVGMNASRGPRDGVEAERTPEDAAVKKVPLWMFRNVQSISQSV